MAFLPGMGPPRAQPLAPVQQNSWLRRMATAMMQRPAPPAYGTGGALAAFGQPFAAGIAGQMADRQEREAQQGRADALQRLIAEAAETDPNKRQQAIFSGAIGQGMPVGEAAQIANVYAPPKPQQRQTQLVEGNLIDTQTGEVIATDLPTPYRAPERRDTQIVNGQLIDKQTGEVIATDLPTTGKRETLEDVTGRRRYVDTGELVFPDAANQSNPMLASLTPDAGTVRDPQMVSAEETAEAPVLPIERDLGFQLSPTERVSLRAIAQEGDSEKFGKAVRDLQTRRFDQANTLRDEYTKQTAPLNSVIGTANRAAELLDASIRGAEVPVDQVETMYLFVRGLDPTSVVREGEVALAQQVASMQDRLETLYDRYAGEGALMPKDLKEEMLATIYRLGEIAAETRQTYTDEYGQIADRNYIPREDVLIGRRDLSPDALESFKDQYGLE